MKNFIAITVVIFTIIAFVSCNSSPQTKVVGKWREVSGTDTIEFKSDKSFKGNVKYGMAGVPREITGTYFIDNDAISINLGDNAPMTWKYKFSDGALIVMYEQGGHVKIDNSMAKFTSAE